MGDASELPASTAFSRSKFIHDFTTLSNSLNAPYSQEAIESSLTAFAEHLDDSSVVIRCTSRPGDILNFRIFLRRRVDTITLAAKAGFIRLEDPLAQLVTSWSCLNNDDSEQWCDFNPETGLAKTWINFRRLRPITQILSLPNFPSSVQAHATTLQDLGLNDVCFSAVDYHGRTINIYFVVKGSLTPDQAARYTSLAACSPPTEDELANMRAVMGPAFAFAVTIEFATGRITRVAFYALEVPRLPELNERLTRFFGEVTTYDRVRTAIVSWSYGRDGKKYMKGEFGYAGELAGLLGDMVKLWKGH